MQLAVCEKGQRRRGHKQGNVQQDRKKHRGFAKSKVENRGLAEGFAKYKHALGQALGATCPFRAQCNKAAGPGVAAAAVVASVAVLRCCTLH